MKKITTLLVILISLNSFSQGFNEDKTALTNFVKRMYKAKPFEGVKIVEDYDNSYLLSVLSLENGKYGKLVPIQNHKALARGIEDALNEDHNHSMLIERAQLFSVKEISRKYLEYFRSCP